MITSFLSAKLSVFNDKMEIVMGIRHNIKTATAELDSQLKLKLTKEKLTIAIEKFDAAIKKISTHSTDTTKQTEIDNLLKAAQEKRQEATQLQESLTKKMPLPTQLNASSSPEVPAFNEDHRNPISQPAEPNLENQALLLQNQALLSKNQALTLQITQANLSLDNLLKEYTTLQTSQDPFIKALGQLNALIYAPHAASIKKLVRTLLAEVLSLEDKKSLTKAEATTQLENTYQLLMREITPQQYLEHINHLPGHPRNALSVLAKIMTLLGVAVLAALGTAIGLGISIPSVTLAVPVVAAAASLTTLAGVIGLFSARSKGLHQIENNMAHHVGKLPTEAPIAHAIN